MVALLVVALQVSADVRYRLRLVDERLSRLSERAESDAAASAAGLQDLSSKLSGLSQSTRSEIGSVGRSTRTDLSRLREGLTGRLDEVTQRVSALAVRQVDAAPTEAAALAEGAHPSALGAANAAVSPAPPKTEPAVSPAQERDLSISRQSAQGEAWFQSGQYRRAREVFATLLAQRPDDAEIQLYYAASLFRSNPGDSSRYAQIEKDLLPLLAGDPPSVLALDTLASLEVEQGRWPQALEHLRQLAALAPQDPRYPRTAGFCALRVGDTASACELYSTAATLSPTDTETLSSLGDCQWSLGQAADARRSWQAALSCLDTATPAGARAGAQLRARLERVSGDRVTP